MRWCYRVREKFMHAWPSDSTQTHVSPVSASCWALQVVGFAWCSIPCNQSKINCWHYKRRRPLKRYQLGNPRDKLEMRGVLWLGNDTSYIVSGWWFPVLLWRSSCFSYISENMHCMRIHSPLQLMMFNKLLRVSETTMGTMTYILATPFSYCIGRWSRWSVEMYDSWYSGHNNDEPPSQFGDISPPYSSYRPGMSVITPRVLAL